MTIWDFFNEHWFIAGLTIFGIITLLESVLTIINNMVKVYAAKAGVICNDNDK